MATRSLLRRLPLPHLHNLNPHTTSKPTTAAFSYFLRRNISSSLDESLSRSSPNDDNDFWASEPGGRAFGSAVEDNDGELGVRAFGLAEEGNKWSRSFGSAKEANNGDRAFGSAEKAGNRRSWTIYEREILKDIEGTVELAKEILQSGKYNCGDKLSPEDEKVIVERLLAYHPHREDKIGCGLDSIMIDKHLVYGRSICFFVVRADRSVEDFSYRKCLGSYVKQKYPHDAEGFIWKMRQFFWREENDAWVELTKG